MSQRGIVIWPSQSVAPDPLLRSLVNRGGIDVDAPLQSLFPFEKNRFKFRPSDGSRRITYLLDQVVGRFKGAASELTFQCTEEKEVRGCKVW
jgi:hypothetical protein